MSLKKHVDSVCSLVSTDQSPLSRGSRLRGGGEAGAELDREKTGNGRDESKGKRRRKGGDLGVRERVGVSQKNVKKVVEEEKKGEEEYLPEEKKGRLTRASSKKKAYEVAEGAKGSLRIPTDFSNGKLKARKESIRENVQSEALDETTKKNESERDVAIVQKTELDEQQKEKDGMSSSKLNCRICGEKFEDKSRLHKHIWKHNRRRNHIW